jgi:hypothetical protein
MLRIGHGVVGAAAPRSFSGPAAGEDLESVMMRKKQEFPDRKIEDLRTRRARQSVEGVAAMAEYLRTQKSVLDRTARLRAQRLERERALRETSGL